MTKNNILFLKANEHDQISWLSQLIEALRTLIRSIQMTIIVTPLILSAPVALYLTSYQEMWFDLLIRTIQACGPVYVKLGQWASTRRDLFPNKLCHHLAKLQNQAKVCILLHFSTRFVFTLYMKSQCFLFSSLYTSLCSKRPLQESKWEKFFKQPCLQVLRFWFNRFS